MRKRLAEKSIPALELIDVVGQEPGNTVHCAFGPMRSHIVDLVAKNTFECSRQLAGEVLEELYEIRLQPGNCMIAAANHEQQDMGLRCNAARSMVHDIVVGGKHPIG